MNKEYIGDGVYIEHDDYSFILTTENGVEVSNRIVLEILEAENVVEYIEKIFKKAGRKNTKRNE